MTHLIYVVVGNILGHAVCLRFVMSLLDLLYFWHYRETCCTTLSFSSSSVLCILHALFRYISMYN